MRMENLDTLLYNGRIYTMEAAGDTVEAIGIQDGKIQLILVKSYALNPGSFRRFFCFLSHEAA